MEKALSVIIDVLHTVFQMLETAHRAFVAYVPNAKHRLGVFSGIVLAVLVVSSASNGQTSTHTATVDRNIDARGERLKHCTNAVRAEIGRKWTGYEIKYGVQSRGGGSGPARVEGQITDRNASSTSNARAVLNQPRADFVCQIWASGKISLRLTGKFPK